MARYVEGCNRSQGFLLPECVDDYVDENNPVRAVDAFVDALDLAQLGFGRAVGSGKNLGQTTCLSRADRPG